MKSVVVLAAHPQFAESVSGVLGDLPCRVIHRRTMEDAEPLLVHGWAGICIIDVEAGGVQGTWMVERVLRRAPGCRVVVYANERPADWEEELYLLGVRHVFSKPVRARMLKRALEESEPAQASTEPAIPLTEPAVSTPHDAAPSHDSHDGHDGLALNALRQFSEVLAHSLDTQALVRRFLNLVREHMGVNRAAVFLRPAVAVARDNLNAESAAQPSLPGLRPAAATRGDLKAESTWMRPVCAIGLAPSLSDHVLLSESAGIGGFLMRTGRVLRRSSREAAHPQMRQEFDLLGVEVALPILGRDGLIGAAMLDSRVTGESLTNGELETVFHLLEQVGMALSNIRLHDQIVGSNQLLGEVLRELASACVVVAPDLSVLHVNKSARRALGGASARRSGSFEFADLPEQLGSKVYQVIKTGAGLPSFRYEPADGTRRVFDVSLMPIHGAGAAAGACSALLVMEDRTQADHLQRLEKEADQLRLVRNMADRLAAEIGNAITPLSAYQQLLGERLGRKGDEFLGSLNSAMADGVKRVQRLINQMRYIYREEGAAPEAVKLGPLLEEAFEDARRHHNGKSARMVFDERVKTVQVAGERAALRHALSEILLNGLLASPQDPRIEVRMVEDVRGNGHEEVGIDIVDGGQGFSPTALARGCEPFFTEKSVGAGLGLTAAKKIVDAQLGRLELRQGPHGIVRILLPSEPHKA